MFALTFALLNFNSFEFAKTYLTADSRGTSRINRYPLSIRASRSDSVYTSINKVTTLFRFRHFHGLILP